MYARNPDVRGTMDGFGYSYLDDKLGETTSAAQPQHDPEAYEALNLVNGQRSVVEIQDSLLAEFSKSNPHELVTYLQALESIGVIKRVP